MTSTTTMVPLLLDLALDQVGRRATARVEVDEGLPVFGSHFPRRPVLPGVLILQAISDLAIRYATTATTGAAGGGGAGGASGGHAGGGGAGGAGEWRLAGFSGVKFRRPVVPGDQMDLTVVEKSRDGETMALAGTVTVGVRPVLSVARILLGALP